MRNKSMVGRDPNISEFSEISDTQVKILAGISAIFGVGVTVYWLMPELMSDFGSEVSYQLGITEFFWIFVILAISSIGIAVIINLGFFVLIVVVRAILESFFAPKKDEL